ncbi:hypothetical protein VTG60DRAFT_4860 [Thermothelomyces hinnuleus]
MVSNIEDGTYSADNVLGAGASWSKVHELLFNGDEPARVRAARYVTIVVVLYGNAAKGGGGLEDASGRCNLRVREEDQGLRYLENLLRRLGSFICWTPDGSDYYVNEVKYWVPQPFDNREARASRWWATQRISSLVRASVLTSSTRRIEDVSTGEQVVSAYDADMI